MDDLGRFRINTPRVTHETLDGEVVLVDFELGTYFGLRGVGTVVWNTIGDGSTVAAVVQAVTQRYDGDEVEIATSIDAFVTELKKEHLVISCGEGECGDADSDQVRVAGSPEKLAFQAPRLEKHTDMQELLLLDPIHEVAETGWPNRKSGLDQ